VSKLLKSILQFLLFFGLGAGLLYFAFINLDLDYQKLSAGFRQVNYYWITAALFFSLLSHIIRALRWNMMLEPLGTKPSAFNAYNAVMIGYLFNFAIPRMGEVSRCGVLYGSDKIPVNQSLGTVVVERIFDLIVLLLISLAVLFLQFDVLFAFFSENFFAPLLAKIGALSAAFIVLSISFVLILIFLVIRFKKSLIQSALAGKILNMLSGFADGIKSILKLKQPSLFIAYTLLIWVLYFFNTYSFLQALTETSFIGITASLSILVMGTFGFAAPVSGGIGAYHIFVAKGLALYGVSSVAGGIFGFVSHGMQMLMILVLGALSLMYTLVKEQRFISAQKAS
jgi:glycosyltransferase 2 family protein